MVMFFYAHGRGEEISSKCCPRPVRVGEDKSSLLDCTWASKGKISAEADKRLI